MKVQLKFSNLAYIMCLGKTLKVLKITISILYNQSFAKLKINASSKKNSKSWITKPY